MSCLPHMTEYFKTFLSDIRLTDKQRDDLIKAHKELRERLDAYEGLDTVFVDTFLQGSYKRSTIIRPAEGQASDVDVVCVTKLNENIYTPEQALDAFIPFLEEYYPGKYERQGRSWCIVLDEVDLDLVPTSAPSEVIEESIRSLAKISSVSIEEVSDPALFKERYSSLNEFEAQQVLAKSEEWKQEPLRIPDREAGEWEDTDPLTQISWTIDKNKQCKTHYINVVKAIKWWWRVAHADKKYPKGYPLEHLIGDCCPDDIDSVAQGVVEVFEGIVRDHYAKPVLYDRGIDNDVFKRISNNDYRIFYDAAAEAAKIAREAFDSDDEYDASLKWRELFGESFPEVAKPSAKAAFTARAGAATTLAEESFA